LGVAAAALCAVFGFNQLLIGIWLGVLFYLITHYILKQLFIAKVEDPSKVVKTGIGAYFLIWIVSWILFYSLMHPAG